MFITLLTKTGGWLGPFAYIFGLIMNGIYEFFSIFGIQNIALSIIIFTFITRALMIPLTIKQQKFTKLSSIMNPEIQKVQAKYKGKKDEASMRKQQEETQAIYEKYGANPTAGCLPMLVTLPIMFALYAVINNIPAYVDPVYKLYEYIAVQVMQVPDYAGTLGTLAEGLKNVRMSADMTTVPAVIDVLKHFNANTWAEFATSFPGIQSSIVDGNALTVADTIKNIGNVNGFLGLNISNPPGWRFPAILIPILAGGLQFVQTKQIQVKTDNKDNPMAASMNSMNVVMPIMSALFAVTFPIGIGLYWITGSVFAIIQQYFVNKYMQRVDVNELIQKNLTKQSKKQGKRKAYLESKGLSMADLARTQTKNIESSAKEKAETTDSNEDEKGNVGSVSQKSKSSNGSKSISDIANILNSRNEKGDK
ncbi:MAG TPA: YidC/Oxa1 family membrane protein insertase [Clostridiales bacterium]|nr:YidC/Oxa1 family membrane protein insertase [Clostridiales bacterium]